MSNETFCKVVLLYVCLNLTAAACVKSILEVHYGVNLTEDNANG